MQTKLLTIGVVVAILAGLTAFNQSFNPTRLSPEQEAAAKEAEKKIEEAATATDETKTAAADATKAEAATPEAVATASNANRDKQDFMKNFKEVTTWPEELPDTCLLKLELSNGDVVMDLHKDWAPIGAAHFYNLAKMGFYNEARFYRVIPNFMAQIGIAGDPALNKEWGDRNIADDPVKMSNKTGLVSFANTGQPNSRSTSFFINTHDNSRLDSMMFAPIGIVLYGLDVVKTINPEYGEAPSQSEGNARGNAYFKERFPRLDYIKRIALLEKTQ